eukprot:7000328-Alexandrium_andersonii.AAC.1
MDEIQHDGAEDRLEALRRELIELGQDAAAEALPKSGKGGTSGKEALARNLYAEAAAYATACEKRVEQAEKRVAEAHAKLEKLQKEAEAAAEGHAAAEQARRNILVRLQREE